MTNFAVVMFWYFLCQALVSMLLLVRGRNESAGLRTYRLVCLLVELFVTAWAALLIFSQELM